MTADGAADSAHVELIGAAEDPGWLVIIDAQRIFADPASEWASPFWPGAWARIRELADQFGPERTLLTRWLPTADRDSSWGAYFDEWPFADVPADDPLYELVDGARELSVHPTIDEPTFGKWGPQLEAALGDDQRITVVGVSTDCCVISTVLPAADAGAWVCVDEAGCAASSAENGEAALAVMRLFPPQVSVGQGAAEEQIRRHYEECRSDGAGALEALHATAIHLELSLEDCATVLGMSGEVRRAGGSWRIPPA
ncbi:cysteine hydrolase family protein [Brachybacterium sp. UMB0905]|uniref:cysteine hydrolase family protein n=1 Tax=Brachybacterium sp. UMB0905 TaxID=2069310 RepID=UPI000C7FEE72|nr:nicotinamidase [Brachybacterium sp. UMB0905]